jgi:hypothetical protein
LLPASVTTSVPVSNSRQRETDAPGRLGPFRQPTQPPGDHQVQNEEQLAFQREDDALADAPQADDLAALGRDDRRDRGAQQERFSSTIRRSVRP